MTPPSFVKTEVDAIFTEVMYSCGRRLQPDGLSLTWTARMRRQHAQVGRHDPPRRHREDHLLFFLREKIIFSSCRHLFSCTSALEAEVAACMEGAALATE